MSIVILRVRDRSDNLLSVKCRDSSSDDRWKTEVAVIRSRGLSRIRDILGS